MRTEEQAESGAGLAAQRSAITAECARRGWKLTAIYEDAAASGKGITGRLGLQAALEDIERGRAEALVVAKLDRLSRSLLDFATLMERSQRQSWALVALDLGVDTTTLQGELMATVSGTASRASLRHRARFLTHRCVVLSAAIPYSSKGGRDRRVVDRDDLDQL